MTVETTTLGVAVLVGVMAIVTLLTRWGGVWIMARVPIGPRVRRFIHAMSGSVLIAVLAPIALEGDGGARVALAVTGAVVLLWKKPLPAVALGIVAAAVFRQF